MKKCQFPARWVRYGKHFCVLVDGLPAAGVGRTLAGAQRIARRNLADALGVPKRKVKLTLTHFSA
jgi:hypothetical protein